MRIEKSVVGFDFGTTNSLVSVIQGDRAINYLDQEGLPVPSVVCYEGASKTMGREAKKKLAEAGLGIQGNIIRSPKFLLGQESVFVEGVEKSPVDIVSDVVRFVADTAMQEDNGRRLDSIEHVVVTIPIDMDGYRRSALRDAFRKAGITIVQFVHEPLAALYGFFRLEEDPERALRQYEGKFILVFDWGGGTLDLTLCRIEDGMLVQIRNDGTDGVGGDMFDEVLRNEIVKRVMERRGFDETTDYHPDAMARLLHRCERAKIDLSSRESVELYVNSFFRGVFEDDLEFSLSRDGLEEIVAPLLDRGLKRVEKLLSLADVSPAQVSACLATGGMSNMPAIKSRLHEWFGATRVYISDRSGTLIAEGAAWIAHDRAKMYLAKNIELLLARDSRMTLVPTGTVMPIEGEVMKDGFHLYCCDPRDGHAKFQIESPQKSGKRVRPNERRDPLAVVTIPVDSAAKPFQERLELEMRIDDNLILHAIARALNVRSMGEEEVHNLEFALQLPFVLLDTGSEGSRAQSTMQPLNPGCGNLVMRSNIARRAEERFVPGELLYSYDPGYFDCRRNPPDVQVHEKLYYEPCVSCKRASNDPLCRCDKGAATPVQMKVFYE